MACIPVPEKINAAISAVTMTGDWMTPEGAESLGVRKGAYLLLIQLDRSLPVFARRLGAVSLPSGTYFYAGSAYGAGGLAARIKRHFRKNKKIHWHIDRLTLQASKLSAYAVPGGIECQLVEQLLKTKDLAIALDGFGSTDCRTCQSHLLRFC